MRPTVLADTGPLYAAVDPHDSQHPRAQQDLKRLATDRRDVVIAYPTVLEAYTLVLHRLGNHIAEGWLRDILTGAALINPTPEDYREGFKKLAAFPDQSVTLFDATVAVLATRLGCEVWTYDRHFDMMRTAVWRRLS